MAPAGRLRFVPPNAVTASSLVLGVIAVEEAVAGRPVSAAWWGLICMLTDKLDGLLAGLLNARSEFGLQLDSLADMVTFGIVPSTVFYAWFATRPQLGWADGWGLFALRALCATYVVAVGLRLARYNVTTTGKPQATHYTGVPSTMTSGMLITLFLTSLKYADPALSAPATFDPWRMLGGLRTDGIVRWVPLVLIAGAVGMLSNLRVPRLGRTRSRALDAFLLVAVLFGYTVGLARRLPEYLLLGGLVYLGGSFVYHLRAQRGGV
jgi:phosphatidylserine synthase